MKSSLSLRQTKLIHVAIWLLILAIPLFKTENGEAITLAAYIRFAIAPLSFMVVFYINYSWFIQRYLFKKKMLQYWLYNLVLVAVVMLVVYLLFRYLLPPDIHHRPMERSWQDSIQFFFGNFMLYFLVICVAVALRMTVKWYQSEREREAIEKMRAEAELQNLKSQLNPHFLFNTLNNIYSLIQIDQDKAQTVVHDLSKLLRYMLYQGSEERVPLTEEFKFMKNYIALMRIRLSQQVNLKVSMPDDGKSIEIAPLLFISLLENAFKHGVSGNEPSDIEINFSVHDQSVFCDVSNSYFPKSEHSDRSGSGIGLVNLKRRLDMIYPGNYHMTSEVKDGIYRVELLIKIPS